MTDADDRLRALFAHDEPPARDPQFQAAVIAELARRRFLFDVALLSGACLLGGIVLWLLWPSLSGALADLGQGLAPVAACLTLGLTAVALLEGRFNAAARFGT